MRIILVFIIMIYTPMPRAPTENSIQIAVRVPPAWLERADALAPTIARPGIAATRTDVLRAALARGLDALEQELRPPKKRRAR